MNASELSMGKKASNQVLLSVGIPEPQQLPCPSQTLLFDLACGFHLRHQRLCSHDDDEEVTVYLCLTCGSPVFRDDAQQESDFTSPFCLDCFSMFHSRDSTSDDIDLHGDSSITDMDDDDDHEDCDHFHRACHGCSISLEDPALPLCIEWRQH